jgi:hypothetical protein
MTATTLASEHEQLLRDVRRRAVPILALVEARTWPAAELETLLAFVRTHVLRQLAAEEELLFPAGVAAAPLAELSADHVRLHEITEDLQRVSLAPCPLHELSVLVIDLVATLGHHLLEEEVVLAALADVEHELPSIAELTAARRCPA